MPLTELAAHLAESSSRLLDRHRHLILTTLALGWFLLLVWVVHVRPFWHDEVYTVLVSRLPLATMWRAYLDGIDLSPPLNTILTRPIHLLTGEGPVVTRLPAILSYLTTCVVLFAFVRRRSNTVMALAASLLPMATIAWTYAKEARGYGLTMACFACALYGWSEAAAGRKPVAHLTLMSAALAAGMWTHYYFVLAFVPLVIGELVRQVQIGRVSWRPWLAFAAAAAAVLPLLPLAAVASAQRTTFWARPQTFDVSHTYSFILGRLVTGSSARIATFSLLVVVPIVAVLVHLRRQRTPSALSTHDLVACLVALLVPAGGVVLGQITGAFSERYVAYAVVGLLGSVPLLAWSIAPARRVFDVAWLALALVLAMQVTRTEIADRRPWQDALSDRPILADWLRGGDDIVVTGHIEYLPIWYYSPTEAQRRVKYLADPEGQLETTGSDTIDRGYLALSRWLPVPVERIGEFGRAHRHFFLYTPGTDETWTERRIRTWNATITFLGRDGGGSLFEIVH